MRVFVAGASGALGRPLVRALVAAGHEVTGMTRSQRGVEVVRLAGGTPVMVDAFDAPAVERAVREAAPEVVIDQMTALPAKYTAEAMRAAAPETHRIRVEGGANLQRAAEAAGARRFIAQSGAFAYAPGEGLATEEDPLGTEEPSGIRGTARDFAELEARVLGSDRVEGIALRYGFFYGDGTWYAKGADMGERVRLGRYPIVGEGSGVWPWIDVEDAAAATVAALDRGADGVYNIVDDEMQPMSEWLPAYARWVGGPPPPREPLPEGADPRDYFYPLLMRGVSNAKAKAELGFTPRARPWR